MGLLILIIVLILAGAALIALASSGANSESRAITRRVDLVAHLQAGKPGEGLDLHRWALRAEDLLKRAFSFGLRRRWGTRTTGRILMLYAIGGGAALWLLGHNVLRLHNSLAGLLALAGFLLLPRLVLSIEQNRADAQFTDLFPDGIDMVIRMLRAGLPITAAIRTVGTEAPAPVNTVFAELADQVEIGIPLADALAVSGERIQLPDFRFFTVAVALQHATGGNLAATLEILSEIIRKRRALRLKGRAVTAEVRMTSYILAGIPFVIIAGLLIVDRNYLRPLVEDPRGQLIAVSAIISMTIGFIIMRGMTRRVTQV
jgi:tight adherence protein B